MSVICHEAEKYLKIGNSLLNTEDEEFKNVILPEDERKYLSMLKADEKDCYNNIMCFVERLYIANQMAFNMQYTRENEFRIERLDDEKLNESGIYDLKELKSILESINYNVYTNAGRSFLSKKDDERLQGIIKYLESFDFEDIDPEPEEEPEIKEYVDLNTSTKTIRKALRQMCKPRGLKPLSVRRSRGTGSAWVHVYGSLEFGGLTEEEEKVLIDFGLFYPTHGGAKDIIGPDEHSYYYNKALEIIGAK